MSVITALKGAGLKRNEIKEYLAVLELGSTRIHNVAKRAGILRTTAYEVVKPLTKKGLISTVIKSGVLHLEAVDPQKLEKILEENLTNIRKIVQKLRQLKHSVKEKPSVELYEGKEGLKTILEDVLRQEKTYCAYANYTIFRLLQSYSPNFVKKRIDKKIFARIIQERVKSLIRTKDRNVQEYRALKFSPVVFKSNVFIYGDKVAFLTVSKPELIGVVIQNKDIADTQRQVFELLWKLSK